jgi:hypothetical protein
VFLIYSINECTRTTGDVHSHLLVEGVVSERVRVSVEVNRKSVILDQGREVQDIHFIDRVMPRNNKPVISRNSL